MLLSPRPTALLPSTGAGNYSPVTGTKGSRPSYLPQEDGYMAHSSRQAIPEPLLSMGIPVGGATRRSSRTTPSRRETSSHTSKPELPRADSVTSVKSRDSTSSMHRTVSRDSASSSMKRTMSRDSMGSRKGSRQFVIKSKASRSQRPGHLARTPSYSKGIQQISSLTMTQTPSSKPEGQNSKGTVIKSSPSAGNVVRRKALSMSTQDGGPTPPVMRRTFSDENGRRYRRSSSDNNPSTPIRRSSNLTREAVLKSTTMDPSTSSEDEEKSGTDSDSGSDSEPESLQMRSGRKGAPPVRRISEPRRPDPPTLQLRRTSTTSAPGTSPRVVSGLFGIAQTPPQFTQLTHLGPAAVAPPCLTTTPAVVTDLPYAPSASGSSSSVRERLTRLQHGEIGLDDPKPNLQTDSTSADGSSPVDEKSTETTTSGTWKPVSLENTRYALTHQAQDMIRRLSNGPPGALRRTSSPSPPSVPSGWTRPERITRTMQKQMIYRDLEQEASEQHYPVYSPNIARPDSRSDYFIAPVNDNLSNTSLEDDPFLNTFPRLNSELRRITKELDNVKKFSDPVADALQRLAQRKGIGSPIISSVAPPHRSDSILSLTSSWKKRFSPDKRDSLPAESSAGNQLVASPESTRCSTSHDEYQNAQVFSGERESKLREVTRQLWDSWPPRPVQESEEVEHAEEQSTEPEIADTNIVSPTESRRSQSQSPLERRLFTSGLRETWGSALALAGWRQS